MMLGPKHELPHMHNCRATHRRRFLPSPRLLSIYVSIATCLHGKLRIVTMTAPAWHEIVHYSPRQPAGPQVRNFGMLDPHPRVSFDTPLGSGCLGPSESPPPPFHVPSCSTSVDMMADIPGERRRVRYRAFGAYSQMGKWGCSTVLVGVQVHVEARPI